MNIKINELKEKRTLLSKLRRLKNSLISKPVNIYTFIIPFLLLVTMMAYLFITSYEKKKEQYNNQLINEFRIKYNTIINYQNETAQIAFSTIILQDEVMEIYKHANSSNQELKDSARTQLRQKLSPLYERLKLKNIRQFHFHLPNCESFLRFHRPERYGDNLKDVRYSVKTCNQLLVNQSGLEEGRFFNGFRNVFPLIYNKEHLGSVEISMAFESIRKQLQKENQNYYNFIIKKEVVLSKVFETELNHYSPSFISDDYWVEKQNTVGDSLKTINQHINSKIQDQLKAGKSFVVESKAWNHIWLSAFLPINNIEGKHIAYIVSVTKDDFIHKLLIDSIILFTISVSLLLGIFLLFYMLIKKNISLKEEKQTLQQLQKVFTESENRFKQIYEHMQVGIAIVSKNFTIERANPAYCNLLGYTEAELIGKTLMDITHPEIVEENLRKQKQLASGKIESFHLEKTFIHKDGSLKYGLLDAVAIRMEDNKTNYFIGSVIDISRRKIMEEELKKALEKVKESDQLKSAFLSNMSHEIRTPMNGILGFSGLLKNPDLKGQQREKYIEIIEKSGHRMLNTINDIIDISKIQSGQVKIYKTEFSVLELLDDQYSFFKPETLSKNIELNALPSLSKDESMVVTDKFKLEGILINLIKNAIKFTEKGSIVFGCSIPQNNQDEKYMEFFVKDTGIGIPKHRMHAIFNRFEQADIEDTHVFEGSGLGLAISKSYVEMLGGKIWAFSEIGKGSTFKFTIPLETKHLKQITSAKKKTAEIKLKHLSIIVAEDDIVSAQLFDTILKDEFNKIIYTSNGKETIEELKKNPETDIILMDVKMPEMNGYQATRQIRKFNNDVIIIAQTAFSLAGDREKAIKAGCNDYITKPINKKILFDKIMVCLNQKTSDIL